MATRKAMPPPAKVVAKSNVKSAVKKPITAAARASAESKRWQAEQDLRTLREAKAIQEDSKRVKAATVVAAEQIKAIQSVVGK